jgi:hypothetical protein
MADFETRKGSQIAILIVSTTQPEAIEQYSLRVVEKWQLGRKKVDDGILLLVAKDDRRLRFEVGYGLEGAVNDVTAKRIISEIITPYFRQGQFYEGINAGIDRLMMVVNGEDLPRPVVKSSEVSIATDSSGECKRSAVCSWCTKGNNQLVAILLEHKTLFGIIGTGLHVESLNATHWRNNIDCPGHTLDFDSLDKSLNQCLAHKAITVGKVTSGIAEHYLTQLAVIVIDQVDLLVFFVLWAL